MAEFSLLMEFVLWRLPFARIVRTPRTIGRFALPVLGCAVALAAGCSGSVTKQATPVAPSQLMGQAGQGSGFGAPSLPPPPKSELVVPDHPSIDVWVKRFSIDKRKSFQTQLERACNYVAPSQEVFEQKGLPKELVYVAMVESGFSPTARSSAKAVGMWQFIDSTGKRFGLEQNRYVDERRHPMKAARAAADYLSFLYDKFGSWSLALAAYNCGENGVQRALDQSGLKTFWELRENGRLPAETCDYVPKVFATVKITSNPAHYGFFLRPEQRYVKKHETVTIPGGVKLAWIGKHTGIPEASLESCNPELCKPVTPPGCSSYALCVPVGKGEDVLTALAEHPYQEEQQEKQVVAAPSKSPVVSHTIRSGDTWSSLAARYKSSAKELAALNHVSPSKPLKKGQTIKIRPGKSFLAVAKVSPKQGKASAALARADVKKTAARGKKTAQLSYYPVRRGDTLYSISQRFGVPVKTLCAQNELHPNQKLIPGDRLAIRTGN